MSQYAQLRIGTGLPVYLCDPHSYRAAIRPAKTASPKGDAEGQRGTNENTDGLLRQSFPKGTQLGTHGADDLAAVAAALNGRPRKTLGWRTPAEALDQLHQSAQTGGIATTG